MKFSIRYKLLFGFALVLLLSFAIQAVAFGITKNYVDAQIANLQLQKAQSAAEEIQNLISSIESHHLGFARVYQETFLAGDQEIVNIVNYTIQENPFLRKITFLIPSGREIIKIHQFGHVPSEKLSYEILTTPFKIASTGKTAISKVYFLAEESGPQVDIFSPIISEENITIGVIKGQIDLTELWNILAQVRVGESGFTYVVDEEGRLIAHPNQELIQQKLNLSSRNVVAALLENNTKTLNNGGYLYLNEKNVQVVSRGVSIPKFQWLVIAEQPTSEAFTFLNFTRNLFFFTTACSFSLLVIISFLLSKNLTQPIRELQLTTQLLKEGRFTQRVQIKSGDEIEDLGESFNLMADQLIQRENLIRSEKQQMEVLLQSLYDGVIAVDQNLQIVVFNKAAEKITGLTASKVVGQNIDQALVFYDGREELLLQKYLQKAANKEKPSKEKNLTIFREKQKVVVSTRISPVVFEDQAQNGWMITFHDVTQEQELEEMKLDFVAMAAHELRTPLTAIRGYLALLLEELIEKLNVDEKTFLDRAIICSKQLSSLVENLLNVSRIEKGALKLERTSLSIEKTIRSVLKELSGFAIQKRIQLSFEKPTAPMPLVDADKFRISEVLNNLINNAINYTQEGGWVKVNLESKVDRVIVHIVDNGRGIPESALPHLFTKFYRISGKLAQGSKGTGLGLFISEAIVDAHQGKIWVKSSEGKGSTFSFSLPIA